MEFVTRKYVSTKFFMMLPDKTASIYIQYWHITVLNKKQQATHHACNQMVFEETLTGLKSLAYQDVVARKFNERGAV